ncbi:Dopey, N-terminal-domain-containing protein [Peziza echinospora]|nr:Dopey, N-terminal-domain-containing protein [Peziza echinospora]
MSLEPGIRRPQTASPMSSGRASPAPRRRNDDGTLLGRDIARKDPKYKRYTANIEKALVLFEGHALQEWADYISFLGRLLKALQSYPTFPQIPQRVLVSKRLAQCLNSRLPSGVHQKTIEVYSYIFSLIGRDGLASDLTIWTPGLMPVLSYASITVKPHYLSLLGTFYLPLGQRLRPALKPLILALLPGIDEEGGEYFDEAFNLIEGVRTTIDDEAYFWQCFLLATITSQTRRQGALAFLTRKLPKIDTEEGLTSPLVSPEPGLLLRCFSAGLHDDNLLVQRGFLDLLVQSLPLSSPILQKLVSPPDLELLITSAAGVVLRRDMSLNRRLWVWFLGPEFQDQSTPNNLLRTKYFQNYGLQGLIRGLRQMIESDPSEPAERAQPARICLSLMDRWEIGGLVVPDLFLPVVRSIKTYEKTSASPENYQEVMRSGAMFFDGVESHLIWGVIHETLTSAMSSTAESVDNSLEKLELVSFILKTFNVREEEMVVIHAPLVVLALLVMLREVGKGGNYALTAKGFGLIEELLELIPQRAFHATKDGDGTSIVDDESIIPAINKFYSRQSSKSNSTIPFSANVIGGLLLREVSDVVCEAISLKQEDGGIRFRILVHIMKKVPRADWSQQPLVIAIKKALSTEDGRFPTLQGSANAVAAMYAKGYLGKSDIDNLIYPIVERIWGYLSPETPKYHVEAVRTLWVLQDVLDDRRVEAAISRFMTSDAINGIYEIRLADAGRRFSVLWAHSISNSKYESILTRPLFLFLDSLVQEGTELHVFARGWLQNIQATSRLFGIILNKLLSFPFLRDPGKRDPNSNPLKRHKFQAEDDLDVCSYYLQTLSNVLRYSTDSALALLAKDKAIANDEVGGKLIRTRGFDEDSTIQEVLVNVLVWAIDGEGDTAYVHSVSKLHRTALSVLHQILLSPYSESLASLQLDGILIARLISLLNHPNTYIQVSLLDVLYVALKLSMLRSGSPLNNLRRVSTENPGPKNSRLSISIGDAEKANPPPQLTPPAQLVKCLIGGFSSPNSRPVLDSWVNFLAECLPLLTEVIYQILIPLVECMVEQIRRNFELIKSLYAEDATNLIASSEYSLVSLLNGLEQLLATAHDKLVTEEVKNPNPKSPHETTGFFGNMVSGVFAMETPQSRNAAANNRLTVLLCFQDTVRICYRIWSWGDQSGGGSLDSASLGSFAYTSMKLRSRSRRILEHMFAAETLECLETLIQLWVGLGKTDGARVGSIFKLINVLDGSRPKFTVPAIFNAIYSRTTPLMLESFRKSTLTAEITDLDVVVFLVEYALSLEDDAMDEIWTDCITFLKDVLANPFPHRQSLPCLLHFISILGGKVDNTNFGEQKKMRRELGDLFLRLLTAAFTVRPINTNAIEPAYVEKDQDTDGAVIANKNDPVARAKAADIIEILASVVPQLRKVLIEQERILTAVTTISTSIIGPMFRSKVFPQNVSPNLLDLLFQLTRIANAQRAWKKDLSDAFLDPKFFLSSVPLVKRNWLPLLRQWLLGDRDRLTDLLQKITPPTTAGVLFGVGANSARAEADRRTQLNLRRIACLIFAADTDNFVVNLKEIEDTVVEVLSATSVTSPSSATRGDVYLVLRALILRMSPVHLNSFWPLINTELQAAISSMLPEEDSEYSEISMLQACKLLDTLLVIAPEEFQLHEWLFITDSIEAVYRPPNWAPSALSDLVASYSASIDLSSEFNNLNTTSPSSSSAQRKRKPWLANDRVREIERAQIQAIASAAGGGGSGSPAPGGGQITQLVLRPFLRNLSLYAYECTYEMGAPDVAVCEEMLLADLFEEGGVGGGGGSAAAAVPGIISVPAIATTAPS